MKVAIVVSGSPTHPTGGIRGYVASLIPELLKKEVNVTLISPSESNYPYLDSQYFNFNPIMNHRASSNYRFLAYLFLKTPFIKIPKDTIIHVQRADFLLPFLIFHRKNPKVVTIHGQDTKAMFIRKGIVIGYIFKILEIFALKRANKVIVVDKRTEQLYLEQYPWLKDKILTIPIGIDLAKFRPIDKQEIRKKYGFNKNDKIILFVGRLEMEKRVDLLIKTFKIVKEQIMDAKLLIVGEGRKRKELETLTKELKLEKDVIFTGTIEHDKIPEIMNCADVFILCSLFESGPIVAMEAISCGIPIVMTDVGRAREFIKNGFIGRIVKEEKEENIAEAVNQVLNMDLGKCKEECLKIAKNFSIETTARRTIEIYKRLK